MIYRRIGDPVGGAQSRVVIPKKTLNSLVGITPSASSQALDTGSADLAGGAQAVFRTANYVPKNVVVLSASNGDSYLSGLFIRGHDDLTTTAASRRRHR